MEREIARFNERLTIQKNSVSVDQVGNHVNRWEDYYSCYCYAGTYQYDSERESAVTTQEQSVKFEVRYCSELKDLDSTHYRVVFHGGIYDVQSVDMMNYQRRTIRIICKREEG